MSAGVNEAGYERRLAVVEKTLHGLGLEPSNISPLAYIENYPYQFNNYLYKVELATPASHSSFPGIQPGTTKAPPSGVSSLVFKLSNVAVEPNNVNRVENDVAVQHLVCQSMSQRGLPPLIPPVYAWSPSMATEPVDEAGFGWILSELKSGVDLDSEFKSLAFEDKEQVLDQIAAVLAAIQAARLPASVTKFGTLTFDGNGQIVGGEEPTRRGKPVDSYGEWMLGRLRRAFLAAAQSSVIQGWERNDIHARIETFLTGGALRDALAGVDGHQKGIIHGDFTTNNMLFDKETKKLTAVLDFDWAYISNPFEEFIFALGDLGCNVRLGHDKISEAILLGDFSTPPVDLDEASTGRWEISKAWNSAMTKQGVASPANIKGADKIRDLMQLHTLLCPHQLGDENIVKKMDEKKTNEILTKTETDLVEWLEKHGC
ncbi:Aminoglycoside phosphotransferase [Niveomyces insectorum RCEF 264]|uniref:non-specific serine/threonine protein kinase n=1 Tax=Niveomyces insectorum RCEF 264 TaxID=1081102 RepID=A0A167P4L5_9HYPO|nr:Aminoglycoside phosphotransferase [Niveomyces insectorum RCEF 264]